ncbi:MAG: magnesium transporter CorA family protein [Deltaproteobacteria bacterium]|jgi:magnesium transporter|nr:magnesium transporter CorA family protein [Deltaproteobacteria bacterium]
MLDCYKFAETGYAPCSEGEAEFFDLQAPDAAECEALAASLGVPPHFLSDPVDPKERPRIEQEAECTLIIIRVPLFAEAALDPAALAAPPPLRPSRATVPLGIVITRGRLVTVSLKPRLVQEYLGRHSRRPAPRDAASATFKLFIESAADFIGQLDQLEALTEHAEATLSRAQHNEELMTLLAVDKILIHYSVALRSNRNIMERIMDHRLFSMSPEETDMLERALTENQQAIYMAEIFGQVLGSMSDTFGTVISNNLNKVMKFLTGVTIVLMIPTFIVGAYGMNVRLPLETRPWAFWLISLVCLLSCGLIWAFFSRRKWL